MHGGIVVVVSVMEDGTIDTEVFTESGVWRPPATGTIKSMQVTVISARQGGQL